MSKEFLSKCPAIIHRAEAARASGQYKFASLLVRGARVSPRRIVDLENSAVSDLMRAWRIDVVANTSAAKRVWSGERAAKHLIKAEKVITTYYNHPTIKEKAPQFKKDNEGNPYDFAVEMLRDRARYCLAAAAITGDTSFMLTAEGFLSKALEKASEVTAAGLARMELGIHTRNFNMIKQGFGQTYEYSLALGNLDRARWAARTYFGESLKGGKILESLKALRDLAKIRKNPVKIAQDAIIGVVRSSEILSWPQRRLQRATLPKGFNSESLKIS